MDGRGFDHNPVAISLKEKRERDRKKRNWEEERGKKWIGSTRFESVLVQGETV